MIIKLWNNYFFGLEACINDISSWSWMTSNLLKLNQDKTKLIIFTTEHAQHQKHLPKSQLKVSDHVNESVPYVKKLGEIFDQHLTVDKHLSSIAMFRYGTLGVYNASSQMKPAKPWLTL